MNADPGGWGGGYVTDIAYLPGYYPNQSPLHLHLACLLGGVAGVEIGTGTPLSYLELGCGHGFGALVLAASNPAWRVVGVDFNPAHIAVARDLAADAGIGNAHFIEADLATLAEHPLAREIPSADVATMHGLWSWVSDAARAGIVRLLNSKVRPGGIVQLSYNAQPGWQGAIGMQRLVREAGRRLASRSDLQAAAGVEIVRALAQANAHHLRDNAFVKALLDHADRAQIAYLAHEYMLATWRPCFHADVVIALADAKLEWVASADLLENFLPLTVSDEVRTILAQFDDPVMRELVKDMCLSRSLRQDVFVRGARRLSNAERDAALGDVMLGLLCSPDQFAWEIEVATGRARIESGFFGPIVTALGDAPQRVRDLLALPGLPRNDNPGELVGMLVGSHQAMRVLGPTPDAGPDARARRLNAAAARRFVRPDNLNHGMALATSGTGAPLSCPMLDLFVAERLQSGGAPDPVSWADTLGAGHPPPERERLRTFLDRILADRAPVWCRLGALPPPGTPPL
jgi:SAM-dependent methyltransferase